MIETYTPLNLPSLITPKIHKNFNELLHQYYNIDSHPICVVTYYSLNST
jgi:hypothetical protein